MNFFKTTPKRSILILIKNVDIGVFWQIKKNDLRENLFAWASCLCPVLNNTNLVVHVRSLRRLLMSSTTKLAIRDEMGLHLGSPLIPLNAIVSRASSCSFA